MGGNSSKSPPNGGLRVHRVYPNGPGDVAGIEPFFDYVLDADGYTYTDDSDETLNLFTKYVNDHENQQICLNVYNARKKSIREVFIVPQKWDGIGLLGLTLKFGLFTCLDQGAHVIHIYDKSPAQKAGLMPITDYLLGTNLQLFFDLDCVRIHVANQVDKEVVLIVYNSVTETVRRAVIVPKENWGGKGTLGCDLAKGYIHRIPYVKSLFTYPTIDSYPTFDSNLSKEVVDTIDLSIGNVDNYYNSSSNTTLRQDLVTSERSETSLEKDKVTSEPSSFTSDPNNTYNKDTSSSLEEVNKDKNNKENEVNLSNDTSDGNDNSTSNLAYTPENLLLSPSHYQQKLDPEVGENVNINVEENDNELMFGINTNNKDASSNQEEVDKDNEEEEYNYNQVDLNNSYQPPSMLNLDFSSYSDKDNLDLTSFVDQNNLESEVNFSNPENLVNPVYNNDKLFTQDLDNV